FGINPREAEVMDPQHRLFLECSWEALERAGYDAEQYAGRLGVYAGVGFNTYLFNLFSNPELINSVGYFQTMIGNGSGFLSTLLSYKLNLTGPSINVQTACSTSLVAVHLACQSLLNGESDMVLAGGSSLTIPQVTGYLYQEGGIESPDGRCRSFDAKAQGTIGASGVAVVVLKRMADAVADGDVIHAVIKGSAVNNDGAHKVGFTAPSLKGQSEVIVEALAVAGVDAETVTYVEAHGTATPLGDPIELAALTQAFRTSTDRKGFCAVGSVKSNFGHTDTAAGVAGLIKTVLALRHKELPPSLHFERPNPQIDFESSPFFVNSTLRPWAVADAAPRRAGVSSFGIGGTNAHVVLEEAPEVEAAVDGGREHQLLVLSAKTSTALETATANLVAHLEADPAADPADIADIAYTLQVGRRRFAHRRTLVCRDRADAAAALAALDPKRVFTTWQEAVERPVVFMFSGQGTQYARMGAALYESAPVYREHFDRCAELLRPRLGLDLRAALGYDADGADGQAADLLQQTRLTQPALFAVEYALAQLWMSWGVKPAALVGHSLGEYVAACVSGVLTLEDALRLVAARGRLMQEAPAGAMLSVALGEAEVAPLLGDSLSLAAVNGAELTTVAGPAEAVAALEEECERRGVACRRLLTSHAFHSAMMDDLLPEWLREVRGVELRAPRIPFVSNLTGTWATAAEVTTAEYWVRHLREPVRFAAGAGELLQDPARVFLEVGPGQTLATLLRRHAARGVGHEIVTSLRAANEPGDDSQHALRTLARLWMAGVEVNWQGLHDGGVRRRVELPTYPFERRRYWVELRRQQQQASAAPAGDATSVADEPGEQRDEGQGTARVDAPGVGATHERPPLASAYEPPRNEVERELVA
ncbi:MAG TPA: type I polyketide synthase, partial [Pyrinomonadaceae bacterium]